MGELKGKIGVILGDVVVLVRRMAGVEWEFDPQFYTSRILDFVKQDEQFLAEWAKKNAFFDNFFSLITEVKQLRVQVTAWQEKAKDWAAKVIELQETMAKKG